MVKKRKKNWDQKIELATNSYLRSKNNCNFSKLFYEHLFYLNPKIKDLFTDTDFEHQEKALLNGLDFLFGYLKKDETSRQQITRLARVHSVYGLNIHPHYYYYWSEALVLTIKDADPDFYKDLEYYVREVISYPISFIISQYFTKSS